MRINHGEHGEKRFKGRGKGEGGREKGEGENRMESEM
jgi:hypothetical protein